jgi:uncharacterized membrane protein YidH (DUF202 family)
MSLTKSQTATTDRNTLLAEQRTSLAVERSRIAGERTMMAWVRTSLSMISFGFTIFKFFQYLRQSNLGHGEVEEHGPRNLGLALIVLGVVVLVAAAWQHYESNKKLARMVDEKPPRSTALITGTILAAGGLLVFLSLLFRFGPF